MLFVIVKGQKQCLPLNFFFYDDVDVVAYFMMG
jgi:hypothetical protein